MNCGIRLNLFAVAALAVSAFAAPATNPPSEAAATLAEKVRHELVMMPYYGVFDNLAFHVNGVNVTLLGEVNRPTLKDEAERRVKSLPGVETVDNQIRILPLSPNDDRICLLSMKKIYGHPALNRYSLGAQPSIRFIVENGTLTLKGTVANKADRDIAGILANTVPGAFAVRNELVVN